MDEIFYWGFCFLNRAFLESFPLKANINRKGPFLRGAAAIYGTSHL
jgi:hypothetical protein